MTDYTIASPNGGTWSIQSTNTAKTGRAHDLAMLTQGASGAGNVFARSRAGFLNSPPNASGIQIPGAALVAATTGWGWQVNPFAAVVERNALVDPYLVVSTAMGSGAVTTADPSQTRIDRLDLVVLDGALGDNAGTSLTKVAVTPGTPGLGLPAAPANSIPIWKWSIPPGSSSLAAATATDLRHSAGLNGADRVLLGGDALTDAGFMVGEKRLRYHATYGWLIDYWDPGNAIWRGTQVIPGLAQVWANGTSDIPLTGGTTYNQIITVPVADPGWPYKLRVSCRFRADYTATWPVGTATWGPPVATMQLGIDFTGDGSLGYSTTWPPPTCTAGAYWGAIASESVKLTGAHTVYLMVLGGGGGGGAWVKYAFFSGNTVTPNNQVDVSVDIIPAGI